MDAIVTIEEENNIGDVVENIMYNHAVWVLLCVCRMGSHVMKIAMDE